MKRKNSAKTIAAVMTASAVILFVTGCNLTQNKINTSNPTAFSSTTLADSIKVSSSGSNILSSASSSSSQSTYTSYDLNMDFLSQSAGYMCFKITSLNDSGAIKDAKNYFLKTVGGGVTWSVISNESSVVFTDFINPVDGYCLEKTSNNSGSTAYSLAKTLSSGASWSQIHFEVNNILSLQAVNLNTLFVITGKLPTGQGDVGNMKIYRSINCGGSWEQIKMPPVYHSQSLCAMYWLSAKDGYIMCMENSGAGNVSPKTLYYTCDGGLAWSVKSRSDDPTNSANVAVGKISGAGCGMGSMYFYSDSVGYYNSFGESIFKTTNSGSDFSSVNPLGEPGGYISNFDMVNENIGYAYMNDTKTLYRTANGGTSWKAVTTPEKIAAQLK